MPATPATDLAALPDPDLVSLVREGDMVAADTLVRRFEGLVKSVVRGLHPPARVDRDDMAQMGRLALVRAARSWKPDRHSRFSTYAYVGVRRAAADEMSDQLAHAPPAGPEPDRLPAPEPAPPPDVSGLLGRLDPVLAGIVRAYYGLDGWPVRVGQDRKKGVPGGSDLLAARYGLTRLQLIALVDDAVARLRHG